MYLNKQTLSHIYIVSATLLLCAILFKYFANSFWDFAVYIRAASDYNLGLNPYSLEHELLFIYHPYPLFFFAWLEKHGGLFYYLILFFITSSILFITQLIELVKNVKQQLSTRFLLWTLMAFTLGGIGTMAIFTGNIAIYIHFLLLSLFLSLYLNERAYKIYAISFLILVFALLKPYFLAYLIIFLAFTTIRKTIYISLITITLFVLIFYSANLLLPTYFDAFMFSLQNQTLGKNDLGFSFFTIFKFIFEGLDIAPFYSNKIAMIIHLALNALFGYLVYKIYKEGAIDQKNKQLLLFCFLIVLAIFLNPRMKMYDFSATAPFIFMALCLIDQYRVLSVFAFISVTSLLSWAVNFFNLQIPLISDTQLFVLFLLILSSSYLALKNRNKLFKSNN